MKQLLPLCLLLAVCRLSSQTFNLTVSNGYGSGSYAAGDTVDVWSSAFPANSVFDKWTGDVSFLAMEDEWHTTVLMPSQDVSIAASLRSFNPYSIHHESIMGRDTLKEVYSFFPPNFKGVVFCFHGTGGNATNWTLLHDYKRFLNDLVADTFAFVITEAEETSTQTDYNANGKIQWNYLPYDSTNIDFANIRILQDTFLLRGITNANTKYFAVGMSNGGAFSSTIASFYNWSAAVSYCAPASTLLANTTTVPIQWCMAKYDNHPNVGAQGNADALAHHQILLSRGVCSRYYLFDHSPVYPERFMQSPTISQTKSANLFAELQSNNLLDPENYLLYASDTIGARIIATPAAYPQFLTLSATDKVFMATQVDVMYSAHQFFCDLDKRTLEFFNQQCSTPAAIADRAGLHSELKLFPNPGTDYLYVETNDNFRGTAYSILDVTGRVVQNGALTSPATTVDTRELGSGLYVLRAGTAAFRWLKQ